MVTKVAHSGHSRPAPDTTWCKQQAEEGWEILQIIANESSAFKSLSPGPRNAGTWHKEGGVECQRWEKVLEREDEFT